MKLFVWNNPYPVLLGHSLVLAVADNVEEAEELARSKAASWYMYGEYSDGSPSKEFSQALGEPTRVVELPCSEWHRWEE